MHNTAMLASNTQRWLWWDWVERNGDLIWEATREHLVLTAWAVGLGLLLALPMALAVQHRPRWRTGLLGFTGALYTIPSLAFFALLIPYTGLSRTTVLIPLTSYTLLILVRNLLTGLDGVPSDVTDAADGMGYTRGRRLLRVELPLALPAVMAGVRIATVTTIGLLTIAALVGLGGLGQLIIVGLNRPMRTAVTVGAVLSVGLAIGADLLLGLVQRLLMPWSTERR
jgi:osmoprotectant transport system permease protein